MICKNTSILFGATGEKTVCDNPKCILKKCRYVKIINFSLQHSCLLFRLFLLIPTETDHYHLCYRLESKTVHLVPKEPSKPMFKSHKEFEKLAVQPSYLRTSYEVSHWNLKLDTDQEFPYCDNLCYFPDVESGDCTHVVYDCNKTADLKTLMLRSWKTMTIMFTNQTVVRKIQAQLMS